MSLWKATRNYALRCASDKKYDHDIEVARNESYRETGCAMKNASRHGKKLNGSSVYHAKLSAKMRKVNQNRNRREKFISDL